MERGERPSTDTIATTSITSEIPKGQTMLHNSVPPNFNLPLLFEAADRFGFAVDIRGVFPIMIMGLKAAEYRSHRDMIRFISIHVESV